MAKPQSKPVHAALPTAPALQPAPDNGVGYVDRPPVEQAPPAPAVQRPAKESVRSYPQLGTRVPPAMFERIQRCCAETGINQSFLVRRALERELSDRGY